MMTNNVNIYYEEKEVHDAFKNYYNEVKQYANVHIFTKNEILLSLYAEDQNVFVHSPGNLWNKFKSWLTGEVAFANQFSKLNISKDKSDRYRSIINRGGTIIIWSQDEPDTVNDFADKAETTPVENHAPLVHEFNPSQEIVPETAPYSYLKDSEENYEQENPVVELQNSSEPSTSISDDNTTSQTDVEYDSISYKNEEDNTSEANGMEVVNTNDDLTIHSNVQDSSHDLSDPSIQEENLFIADENVSKQYTSVDLNFEYYEDGPRKHNIFSENLKKLTHEHVQNDENNDEPSANLFGFNISQETLQQAIDQVSNHFGDALSNLNNISGVDSQMTQPNQQRDNLTNLPSPNELLDLVQQIPPDDLNNIFNMLTSPHIPTDSTESVLDFDLQAIIKKLELGDVKKEFSIELEVEEEMNKTSTEDQDIELNEDPEVEHHVHENYIQDSTTVNTSDQQNESP